MQKIVANGNAPPCAAAQKEWVGGGGVVRKFHDYNQNGVQDRRTAHQLEHHRTEPDGTFSEISLGAGGSRTLAVALDKT